MNGFIETLGHSALDILCLLERTAATSQERANLTSRGLVLCSEYFPILEQSHMAYSLKSGHIDLIVMLARLVS